MCISFQATGLSAETMRVVLERCYNDLRLLYVPNKTLKAEGFFRSNKVSCFLLTLTVVLSCALLCFSLVLNFTKSYYICYYYMKFANLFVGHCFLPGFRWELGVDRSSGSFHWLALVETVGSAREYDPAVSLTTRAVSWYLGKQNSFPKSRKWLWCALWGGKG